MAGLPLSAGLRIVSERPTDISVPPSAKNHQRAPSIDELDAIELPDYGLFERKQQNSIISPISRQSPGTLPDEGWNKQTPKTPNELETSEPPTPIRHEAVGLAPSFLYPKMNKWRVLAACFTYIGNGMNDSAPGALIPYLESWYHIGYAVVSLIFVTNAIGFILAAFFTDFFNARLGRAKCGMLCELIMIAGYVMIVCTPPYPAVVVAYMLVGFGEALNLALNNVFCANLANSTVILGAAHGSYGIGGILGPIIATALVSNGVLWSRFFLIMIGLRVMALAATGWSFWSFEKESITPLEDSFEPVASSQRSTEPDKSSKMKLLGRALKHKTTLIGALFIFAYQGAEVSESGWFISYLINYRNGDPAHVGYVTSGFWAGITVGRFVLTHIAHRVGEKSFVFAMGVGVIVFQLLAWFVPNVIGDAVAVAIVGLLLGPVYPCSMTIFTRLLPANLQMTALSFISSAGSSGGAVVPFTTGLLAQAVGTYVLHPVCIAFFVLMLACWVILPKIRKRTE